MLLSVFLPLSLAFIMFTLGVGLRGQDFKVIVTRPTAFAIGFLHQVLLLPVVVYVVIRIFGITGELAVGFMVLAVCPGGATSNVLSKLARGDVALSVSLTSVTSLLSMVTVPLVMAFAFATFLGDDHPPINIVKTALSMFALTVVPVLLGMGVRALAPEGASKVEQPLNLLAVALFAAIVVIGIVANLQLFAENFALLGGAILALFVVLLPFGYLVPKALGLDEAQARTVSVDTGIQNGSLGIVVAGLLAGQETFGPFAIPSALYGIMMFFTTIPWVMWLRRR